MRRGALHAQILTAIIIVTMFTSGFADLVVDFLNPRVPRFVGIAVMILIAAWMIREVVRAPNVARGRKTSFRQRR